VATQKLRIASLVGGESTPIDGKIDAV